MTYEVLGIKGEPLLPREGGGDADDHVEHAAEL